MDKFLFSACEAIVTGCHLGHIVLALYAHDYEQTAKEALQLLMRLLPHVGKLWSR